MFLYYTARGWRHCIQLFDCILISYSNFPIWRRKSYDYRNRQYGYAYWLLKV